MIGLGGLAAAQQAALSGAGGGFGDDPNWQRVGFSLPLTSDFTDETGKTWTVAGPTVSGGAAVFDGVNDYLRSPAGSDFAFGHSDFTFEGFYKENSSASGLQCLVDFRVSGASYALALYSRSGSGIAVYGQAGIIASSGSTYFSSSVLQHFAVCRQGGTLRFYLDGVQLFTSTAAAVGALLGGGGITAGGNYLAPAAAQWATGEMNHLRGTRGICRYPNGTTFTPPAGPFPTAGGTPPGTGPGAHRYWRLLITDNDGHATYYGMTELVMRDRDLVKVSGYNSTSSGISASSVVNSPNAAIFAFDGNLTSTGWLSANKTPDQWLKVDFQSSDLVNCSVEIREIDIYGSHNAPTASPKAFKLQWSDDNSAWTDALSVTGETGWSANEMRTFVVY